MKKVKCPYCSNIQEATYDIKTTDLVVAEALFKVLDVEHVTVCNCTKCGEGFEEEENKTEDRDNGK